MKAVFLDRDGTIVIERGYLTAPGQVELLPGAAGAIALLHKAGWKLFVVSNQACVAKGLITEEELATINLRMAALLAAEGAEVDGIYCCPHHPEGVLPQYTLQCSCRKPLPGMLEQATAEHGLDLAQCVMIGDTQSDLEAGRAAGARTILVLTGKGRENAMQLHGANHIADDLPAAVAWLTAINQRV
jgi:D-glycero-D-manno-heptose 1,7-bisphosphate phosphatase